MATTGLTVDTRVPTRAIAPDRRDLFGSPDVPERWLTALLVLMVARLWLMPLGSSFWVDETATVFVVEHGVSDPSLAAAPQVPYGLYYWLPRAARALFGPSEIAYRLPSVLLMAVTLWIVALLAARLVHPRAKWFAAFACLALAGFNYQADDARPYALGACIASAGVLCLVRWLDEGRLRDAALFEVGAALLWRVHLILWPFYLVFAGYAAARLLRKETRVAWPRVAVVFGLLALALMPVALDALSLFPQAKAHVIAAPPSLHEFEHSLRWNVALCCAAGAWLFGYFFRWETVYGNGNAAEEKTPGGNWSDSGLLLAWWLVPPAALFACSWITGNSVFVRRYFSIMMPGVALVSTVAAGRFIPARAWNRMALVLGVLALVALGQWDRVWPAHEKSDWRSAAQRVNQLASTPDTPVICPSPFIEARTPQWRPGYRLPGFLYSQLPVYPIRGNTILFPFETSPAAERYAATLAGTTLRGSGKFLLYGGNGATSFWRQWFAARPELAGWQAVRYRYGDVDVIEFAPPETVHAAARGPISAAVIPALDRRNRPEGLLRLK